MPFPTRYPLPSEHSIKRYTRDKAYGTIPNPVDEYDEYIKNKGEEVEVFDGPEDVSPELWAEAKRQFAELSKTDKGVRKSGIMDIKDGDKQLRYDRYGKMEEAGYEVPRQFGKVGKFLSFYAQQHLDDTGQNRQRTADRRIRERELGHSREKQEDTEAWNKAASRTQHAQGQSDAAKASLEDWSKQAQTNWDQGMDEKKYELDKAAEERAKRSADSLDTYREQMGNAAKIRAQAYRDRPAAGSTTKDPKSPSYKDATSMLENEKVELDRLNRELYAMEAGKRENEKPSKMEQFGNGLLPGTWFDEKRTPKDVPFTDPKGNQYGMIRGDQLGIAIADKRKEIEAARTRASNLDSYLRGGEWVQGGDGSEGIRMDRTAGASTNPTPNASVGAPAAPTPVGDEAWDELRRQSWIEGRQRLDMIPPSQIPDEMLAEMDERDQFLNIVLWRFEEAGFDPSDVEVFEQAKRIVDGDIDAPEFLGLQ